MDAFMQASVFVYKCMHGCFHAGICVCNIYMCVCAREYMLYMCVCVCVCVNTCI